MLDVEFSQFMRSLAEFQTTFQNIMMGTLTMGIQTRLFVHRFLLLHCTFLTQTIMASKIIHELLRIYVINSLNLRIYFNLQKCRSYETDSITKKDARSNQLPITKEFVIDFI